MAKEWKVPFSDIQIGDYFVQGKHLHKKVNSHEAIDYEWRNGHVFYFPHDSMVWAMSDDVISGLNAEQRRIMGL